MSNDHFYRHNLSKRNNHNNPDYLPVGQIEAGKSSHVVRWSDMHGDEVSGISRSASAIAVLEMSGLPEIICLGLTICCTRVCITTLAIDNRPSA